MKNVKVKEMVLKFKADINNYAKVRNRKNFHLVEHFDDYEEEYLLFHNDIELDQDEKFQNFVFEQDEKYFISNGIYNAGLIYDFALAEKVGFARGS